MSFVFGLITGFIITAIFFIIKIILFVIELSVVKHTSYWTDITKFLDYIYCKFNELADKSRQKFYKKIDKHFK